MMDILLQLQQIELSKTEKITEKTAFPKHWAVQLLFTYARWEMEFSEVGEWECNTNTDECTDSIHRRFLHCFLNKESLH